MEKFRKVTMNIRGITFSMLLVCISLPCFSQNLTTEVPDGMGMTNDYEFYILFLNEKGIISIAMSPANDTIHICPHIVNTPNEFLFSAVYGYEFGHFYNYVSNGEVINTDTLKQEEPINYVIDSAYWKNSPDINKIDYKGYDGSSVEKAIVIKKATSTKEGIAAEYAYLEKKLGQRGVDWKPLGQYLLPNSSKYYDVIKVKIINTSEIEYFWFDITKFFGKF